MKTKTRLKIIYLTIALLSISCTAYRSPCVNTEFWLLNNDSSYFAKSYEGPCGRVVSLCVGSISNIQPNLDTNKVFELVEKRVKNTWLVPVDSVVYAVRGADLIIACPNYDAGTNGWDSPRFFQVNIDGSISTHVPIQMEAEVSFQCPRIIGIDGIETMYCKKFIDGLDSRVRYLAMEHVCT